MMRKLQRYYLYDSREGLPSRLIIEVNSTMRLPALKNEHGSFFVFTALQA